MALGNINDIATFVAVARAGSFTTAAKNLGMTRSAVGKTVNRLEERLGVRLIHRTPHSFSLSDDGQALFARSERIVEDLEEVEMTMAVRSGSPSGTLRISAPLALGHLHVLPVVESFLDTWRAVNVDLSLADRFVDLVEEGVDIAIRIGHPAPDSRVIARPLATQRLITSASPAYLQEHGAPDSIDSLFHHPLLFFVSKGRTQPWVIDGSIIHSGEGAQTGAQRLRMDSAEALIESARRGRGVIHLPSYLLAGHLKDGALVDLFPNSSSQEVPINVIYPSRRHLTPRVRAFIDALVAAWSPVPPWER